MSVLIINRSNSRCGACGKSCSPNSTTHDLILGYGSDNGSPGCGVEWTHVTSGYVGLGIEQAARALRPDLAWVDPLAYAQ